jgi:PAS domain S-box-containing protein
MKGLDVTRPLRVLHLEDNPRDAEMVQDQLTREGVACDIAMAHNQASFEAALAREPFDLILSDYNLPGYDGIAALKWAQAMQPDAPVIMISGTLGEEEAVKCLHIGATDYLLKDHLGRLVPAVQRALQEADARRTRAHTAHALVQRERALRENEKRTNFALAAAGMGVWEIEFATNRLTWSDTMAPVFGLAPEQAPKTTEEYFQLIDPVDRREVEASVARAIAGERDYVVEFRTMWPGGGTHWVHGRAQVSYETDGTPVRLLGIGIDITARKRLEARLEEAQKMEAVAHQMQLKTVRLEAHNLRIESASRLKSQFLANMSHELRTPLNTIIGFSDVMHRGLTGAVSDQQREFLGDILASSKHLLQLINDVLDLAKVEAGKLEFAPEPVEIAPLVREVLDTLRGLAASKRLRMNATIHADISTVMIDPARIKQILYNYLSNAIKFTPEDGAIEISVSRQDPDLFRIDVTDTGGGIPAADLGKLFVDFQQLDASSAKKHQGTGLGLALTKRLTEAQGGWVDVCSVVGEGSTFSAILPYVTTTAAGQDRDSSV